MTIRHYTSGLLAAALTCMTAAQAASTEQIAAGGMPVPIAERPSALLEPEESPALGFCLSTGWASKYISEGIDSFGEGGVWEFNADITFADFTFTTWYGLSDSINASELKLIGSYDFHLTDSLTLTPSFEHAFANPGNDYSDTPALGLAYSINDWLTVGTDIQWDVKDSRWRGYYDGYTEVAFDLTERVNLSFMVLFGFNDGYLGEEIGHGSNTIDYSLTLSCRLTDNLSCRCSVNYSQALTVLLQGKSYDEETGVTTRYGNEFWVGTYLQYEF